LKPFLPKAVADLAPIWVSATLLNNIVLRYPWDPLSLGFLSLLFVLIQRKKWALFYPALMIATFNRETTYLAVMAVFLMEIKDRSGRIEALSRTALAAMIWAGVRATVQIIYRDNPGAPFEPSVTLNWDFLMCKIAFIDYLNNPFLTHLGHVFPLSWLQFLTALNGTWLLIFPRFRSKDPILRRLALLIPIQLLAIYLVGRLFERRLYMELLPIVLPLALQTFFPAEAASPQTVQVSAAHWGDK